MNHTKNNPCLRVIKDRYLLTKPSSSKEVHHIVLDNFDFPLSFKPGDSLGIYPKNDPILVERIIKALQISPSQLITHPKYSTLNITTFLSEKANISRVNPATASFCSNIDNNTPHADLTVFLEEAKPTIKNIPAFLATLSPLLPRFYSIASAQIAHPHEIHLTVVSSSYSSNNEERKGVASYFLTNLAEINKTHVPCYIQPTPYFTLPQDPSTPIIMIGPGTGIAPFRAFLQQRLLNKAIGENWLFFGEREKAHDFLYQDFLIDLAHKNQLFLDLAFSRDQKEKVYVQHKIYEKGALIWDWLKKGASIYVCGNADPMAKNVETTFKKIFHEFGLLSETASLDLFKTLRKEKRYLADVY